MNLRVWKCIRMCNVPFCFILSEKAFHIDCTLLFCTALFRSVGLCFSLLPCVPNPPCRADLFHYTHPPKSVWEIWHFFVTVDRVATWKGNCSGSIEKKTTDSVNERKTNAASLISFQCEITTTMIFDRIRNDERESVLTCKVSKLGFMQMRTDPPCAQTPWVALGPSALQQKRCIFHTSKVAT